MVGRHRGHERGEVRHNRRGRAGKRDRGAVPRRGSVRGHEPAGGGLQQRRRGRRGSRMGDGLGQVGGVCAAAWIQLLHERRSDGEEADVKLRSDSSLNKKINK